MRSRKRIWQLWAVAASLLAATPAVAEDKPDFTAYAEAADQFDRFAGSVSQNAVPDPSDPRVARVLAVLIDVRTSFARTDFTAEDLEPLMQALNRVQGVVLLYMDQGIDRNRGEAAVAAQGDQNMIRHQDVILPLMGAMVDLAAISLSVQATNLAQLGPEDKAAYAANVPAIRRSADQSVGSMMTLAAHPAFKPETRLIAIRALARNGPVFAATFSLTQRRALLAKAQRAQRGAGPQARQEWDRFIAALDTTSCTGLCPL